MNEAVKSKLVAIANLLADLTGTVAELAAEFGEVKVVTGEKEEKVYTFEEVRKVMSAKSGAGFTAEVRALLEKYGASRLSEVKPEDYAALIGDAEKLGDGGTQ